MKKRNTRQPAATPDTTDLPDPGAALVTPSDVLTQACACCGAILPAPLSRLDALPGQEHLRRAVTVALTGTIRSPSWAVAAHWPMHWRLVASVATTA